MKGGGGGGGNLIFSYKHRLGSIFWVQKFDSHYFLFLEVSRNMNIFCGMKISLIFFGVFTKMDYIKGSFLCILGSRYRMGDILWAAKISNIFFCA